MCPSDIIEQIDAAIACQAEGCESSLDDSPSDDFCSQECQQAWHEDSAALFVGYCSPTRGVVPRSLADDIHALDQAALSELMRQHQGYMIGRLRARLEVQEPLGYCYW